ncbi:polysaccharide deacetylase family protein [Chlamydiifrater phoenicopteri]|uniref:polysaccharide deacetylase family protein n=1 Tax=Chlamydiifrater phoenicopteri TaxID=2681469 RepID=UPI001BD130D6|nr:polysaccharide deacetylase family protein [Chlamydiifrater phoenicopteri]
MRLVLAYRKVSYSSDPRYLEAMKQQLLFCKEHFSLSQPSTIPSLQREKKLLSYLPKEISVTFDHASADFYFYVYPFLCAHKIPATVGVAWRYIPSNSTADSLSITKRTSAPESLSFQDEIFSSLAPFCCPNELLQLAASPTITLASHGIGIRNLIRNPPYLLGEVILSKKNLEKLLQRSVSAFIYPFGRYDSLADKLVRQHYETSFILGNTWNFSSKKHLVYRMEMRSVADIEAFLSTKAHVSCLKNWIKAFALNSSKKFVGNPIKRFLR